MGGYAEGPNSIDNIVLFNGSLDELNLFQSEQRLPRYFIADNKNYIIEQLRDTPYRDGMPHVNILEGFKKIISRDGYDGLIRTQTTVRPNTSENSMYILTGVPIKLYENEHKKVQWLKDHSKESSSP